MRSLNGVQTEAHLPKHGSKSRVKPFLRRKTGHMSAKFSPCISFKTSKRVHVRNVSKRCETDHTG